MTNLVRLLKGITIYIQLLPGQVQVLLELPRNIHPSHVKGQGLAVSHFAVLPLCYLCVTSDSERTSNYDSMRQRLSVDTGGRFKLTKLEYVNLNLSSYMYVCYTAFCCYQALNYIGYTVTPERQEQFRKLDIDEQGKVVLADFIALCKEMFPFESGSGNLNFESQLTLALTQKESLDFPRPNAVGKVT